MRQGASKEVTVEISIPVALHRPLKEKKKKKISKNESDWIPIPPFHSTISDLRNPLSLILWPVYNTMRRVDLYINSLFLTSFYPYNIPLPYSFPLNQHLRRISKNKTLSLWDRRKKKRKNNILPISRRRFEFHEVSNSTRRNREKIRQPEGHVRVGRCNNIAGG